MALRSEVLIDRLCDSLAEPAPIPPTSYYSEHEEYLRRKWDAVKPRGGVPAGPFDPEVKSGWQRMRAGERGKTRPTPQNFKIDKGEKQ